MRGDPKWIKAKFSSSCHGCKRTVKKGDDIFYYPIDRTVLCDAPNCGLKASQEFEAAKFDEDNNRSL